MSTFGDTIDSIGLSDPLSFLFSPSTMRLSTSGRKFFAFSAPLSLYASLCLRSSFLFWFEETRRLRTKAMNREKSCEFTVSFFGSSSSSLFNAFYLYVMMLFLALPFSRAFEIDLRFHNTCMSHAGFINSC